MCWNPGTLSLQLSNLPQPTRSWACKRTSQPSTSLIIITQTATTWSSTPPLQLKTQTMSLTFLSFNKSQVTIKLSTGLTAKLGDRSSSSPLFLWRIPWKTSPDPPSSNTWKSPWLRPHASLLLNKLSTPQRRMTAPK